MRARPECDVAIGVAVDDELVATIERARVRVGGSVREDHPVVLPHRAAGEHRVACHDPRRGDDAVVTEQLLDRRRHRFGALPQDRLVLRVLGEVLEAVAQHAGHRVETRHVEEEAHLEEVPIRDRGAVDLAGDQVTHEVVTWRSPSLGDEPAEVRVDGLAGVRSDRAVGILDRRGVHELVDPPEQGVGLLHREPHELHEDRGRELQREVGDEVARAGRGHPVDELGRLHADPRFHVGHRGRGELGVEHVAVLRVLRWVELERDPSVRFHVGVRRDVPAGEQVGLLERAWRSSYPSRYQRFHSGAMSLWNTGVSDRSRSHSSW